MHLPEPVDVVASDDGRWSMRIHVPPGHPSFTGHFPDLPILPGVVQLDWAARLGRRLVPALHDHAICTGMEQLKFQAVVTPGTTLRLSLSWDAAAQQMAFEFRHEERVCSSGRLRFETGA